MRFVKSSKALLMIAFVLNTAKQSTQVENPFEVVYEWHLPKFKWPTDEARKNAIDDGSFIPENCRISGIKVWKDKFFVTLPRQRLGVPVTVATLPKIPDKNDPSPELQAYPDWDMQKIGNCDAFQYVQSLEIDERGYLWIIDSGHIGNREKSPPPSECRPKLVIIDLNKRSFNIKRSYKFPNDVASKESNILNDLVVDNSKGGYAYISDSSENPGIIVYDAHENRSWKIYDKATMTFESNLRFLTVQGKEMDLKSGNINGIALSPKGGKDRTLYYCPQASKQLYSIPTKVLQKHGTGDDVSKYITNVGQKKSITDGMIIDNVGRLYFGLLQPSQINVWNISEGNFDSNQQIFATDNVTINWADGFAIGKDKNLYVTTYKPLTQKDNDKVLHYRILKAQIDADSYLYPPPTQVSHKTRNVFQRFISIITERLFS